MAEPVVACLDLEGVLVPEIWINVAAKTGIDITELEHMNPRLKPKTLQPGDRVRLRR